MMKGDGAWLPSRVVLKKANCSALQSPPVKKVHTAHPLIPLEPPTSTSSQSPPPLSSSTPPWLPPPPLPHPPPAPPTSALHTPPPSPSAPPSSPSSPSPSLPSSPLLPPSSTTTALTPPPPLSQPLSATATTPTTSHTPPPLLHSAPSPLTRNSGFFLITIPPFFIKKPSLIRMSKGDNQVQLGPDVAEGETFFAVAHIFASFNDTFIVCEALSSPFVSFPSMLTWRLRFSPAVLL